MLNKSKLQELREHLENSQNPLFFFDNDPDGLCSFIILQKNLGRGKGVAIKSYPELNASYIKKVEEFNPDTIFILDKAEVSPEFIDKATEKNVKIVWIDHHQSKTADDKRTFYYNTFPDAEPVTYVAQKVFNNKETLWLAIIGCISDVYKPDFAQQFEKEFPELYNTQLDAFSALHKTEVGTFARMLNFGLMDTTTNVIQFVKYLAKANTPYDLLEENSQTKQFHKRYNQLNSELDALTKKAELQNKKDKLIFFTYAGKTSMSSILANKLFSENPEKLIVVAYKRPDRYNVSIRGKNAKELTEKIIKKIPGATGGGHEEATGMMIPTEELENFRKLIDINN